MKKKRGFTLIELLAVIVVLAIIALIATPIVMNTIKRSKKGAAERSADSYVKQVEVAVATERLNKNEILDGEYQITSDGNLCRDKSASCSDDEKIKIEMNGTKPTSGTVKISNGVVDSKSSNMTIGDYTVSYNTEKNTYEATEGTVEKDDAYYGITYETRSAWGEDPATVFIHISKNYEEKYDGNGQMIFDDSTKEYLSEVAEYVYKKYNCSSFYFIGSNHRGDDTYGDAVRKSDGTWSIFSGCYC